jgi:hypothetical protein
MLTSKIIPASRGAPTAKAFFGTEPDAITTITTTTADAGVVAFAT